MKRGLIRIIGGKWRGRRLAVPVCPHLRPTPDRVRETLFNWLAPEIVGSYCLDLFAGTGALGFEALSRGAAFVVMVEKNPEVVKQLREQCQLFETKDVVIYQSSTIPPLKSDDHLFNLVFLDPPYQSHLLLQSCALLETKGYLASKALIYLESATLITDNDLPSNWKLLKSAKAGLVHYYLAKKS